MVILMMYNTRNVRVNADFFRFFQEMVIVPEYQEALIDSTVRSEKSKQ